MSHLVNGHCARLALMLSTTRIPEVRRHCPRCKLDRPFISSGKFRVNAQKKLVDIWLIFRCHVCDQTWNHAVHERKPVRALPPAELEAYMRNDANLAASHNRRVAGQVAGEADVARRWLASAGTDTQVLHLVVMVSSGATLRLDRALALGLLLGRAEIAALADSGALTIAGAGMKALRRPARDGQEVVLDLTRCPPLLAKACRCLTG